MTVSPRRVAIFGATSDIAVAFARRCAEAGNRLVLAARDGAALARLTADLKVRGAPEVSTLIIDFADRSKLPGAVDEAAQALGGLDVALIAYGLLPDQTRMASDPLAAAAALDINFTSPALLADLLAGKMEKTPGSTIAVITSVAGDRGRQSNYNYGAAKGGLQVFLEGLRHRLYKAGVNVLDIRPGFVSTRMTAHLPQKGPLWATPEKVAADIESAIVHRRAVLYTPWFWRFILTIVRSLPRPLFHRTGM